jgi:hypothetical protein
MLTIQLRRSQRPIFAQSRQYKRHQACIHGIKQPAYADQNQKFVMKAGGRQIVQPRQNIHHFFPLFVYD